jgi:hypothetical protein
MKCRLRQNVIVVGKFIKRDSAIDDAMLSEHLRTEALIAYDLADMGGKVMLLRELNFTTTRVDHEGVRVSLPMMLAAGELVERGEIPDGWKDGQDYKSSWTPEERRELQEKENAAFLKQFQPEPLETAVPFYRSR